MKKTCANCLFAKLYNEGDSGVCRRVYTEAELEGKWIDDWWLKQHGEKQPKVNRTMTCDKLVVGGKY